MAAEFNGVAGRLLGHGQIPLGQVDIRQPDIGWGVSRLPLNRLLKGGKRLFVCSLEEMDAADSFVGFYQVLFMMEGLLKFDQGVLVAV